jgi:hypothetical protein
VSITDRALLVDLKLHAWGGTKTDKEATDTVAETFEAKKSVGSYSKRLLPAEAFREVYRVWNVLINEHNRRTLPWADSGARVIASSSWFEYITTMRRLRGDWETSVDNFCDNYADMIESQKASLGKMFHVEDYPSVDEVRRRFGCEMQVLPIPVGSDFRVEMDAADDIRATIDKQTKDATDAAMKNLAARISDNVSHMAEVLTKANVKSNVLRDSLVDNLRKMADLLPGMNLTQDKTINGVIDDIKEKLCNYDGSSLRADDKLRDDTKKAADAILKKMEGFYKKTA